MEEDNDLKLYNGKFNWYGHIFDEWVRAYSMGQAYRLLCTRIANQLYDKTPHDIRHYFYDTVKYEIKEVKEDEVGEPSGQKSC